MKTVSRSEVTTPVKTLADQEMLKMVERREQVKEIGKGTQTTFTLSSGIKVQRVVPPAPNEVARLKNILPTDRFNRTMRLSRLAIAVHMVPSGLGMTFRAGRGADPYKPSPEHLAACAAEAEELSQIVDENGHTLYVQTKLSADTSWRTSPVGVLYGIDLHEVRAAKGRKHFEPYLLMAGASGEELYASAPGIVSAALYQEVKPFVPPEAI